MSEKTAGQVSESDARAVAEEAREDRWEHPSFAREMFLGNLRMDLLQSLPAADELIGKQRAEIARIINYVDSIDTDAIERDDKIPADVLEGLASVGAFGMKIPRAYGGLGFSQTAYNETVAAIGIRSPALGALLSAHQSIGVPHPLKEFGTEEQRKEFLPRLASGTVSAFALTEPDVGSDPARLGATADDAPDGGYILNGEKLWCTNGPIAGLLVVMARTPDRLNRGRRPITAFVVESASPGLELIHRSTFMGLRGMENGVIRFTNVHVPKENVIWGEGKGLKLALATLNTGRLTIPAMCAAAARWCLAECRTFAAERVQWGKPVGEHDAVAQMLAEMGAAAFAMEAVSRISSTMADSGDRDIRIEAALAKLWNSEVAWQSVDDAMQIRGGRGYETADSLRARGERGVPLERLMRDLRINRIFEGSSEIMRLFVAREAVDPHLKAAGAMVDPTAPIAARLKGAIAGGIHMARWIIGAHASAMLPKTYSEYGDLARHVRFARRSSLRLARQTLLVMLRHGAGLEKRQAVLARIVDAGAEIFAMASACEEARRAAGSEDGKSAERLADTFCIQTRRRIDSLLRRIWRNDDVANYKVAREILRGEHAWLDAAV